MSEFLWKLEHVTVKGQQRPRLENVSIEISQGATAIVGYSGAGKTSLLNLLTRFESPDRGTIQFQLPESQDRLSLYWVPQSNGLWPHLTVRQHLSVIASSVSEEVECGELLLRDFDLFERRQARPSELSQGECARLAVARALAGNSAVLVMDEPLVHVDATRLGRYWKKIRDHCRKNETSIVIATHSPEIVLRETDHAVCLHDGEVMYEGDVQELYCHPKSLQLAEFLGPANWLTRTEAADWLDGTPHTQCCYRPEQIEIVPCETSALVIQSTSFAGSIAEVELLNEQTNRNRRFYHRPIGATLHAGNRVIVKALLTMLLCLMSIGCGSADGPVLSVQTIRHWSMPPDGRKIPAPRAISVGPNNDFYVLDDAGRVLVFNTAGKLLKQWRMPQYDVGKPEGICIFKDGRIAVADTHYHRVVFFDTSGEVLSTLGLLGKDPGQFIYPVAIVQDDAENFYVCEYGENDRIQKFSVDGTFILEFGSFGTEPGQFQRPSGIVWSEGKIYAVDAFNNRIQVFSDTGKFLRILGDSEQSVGLHYPYDITGSPDGGFYVVEYGAGRISKIDRHGKLLGRFGTTGTDEGQFVTPWGLVVDARSHLLVADTGNRRIVELEL